jgi:hypothetical protein
LAVSALGSSDFRWEGQSKVEVAIRGKALVLLGLAKRDQEEEHTWELADWEPEAATLEEMRPREWTSLTVSGIPEDPLYKTLIGYVIDLQCTGRLLFRNMSRSSILMLGAGCTTLAR